MSFKNAAELAERFVERFDDIRSRALKSTTRSQAVVFDSIYELLMGISSLFKTLAVLEGSTSSGAGIRKICGNAVLVRSQDITLFMRLNPLRAIIYNASQGLLRLSSGKISVEVTDNAITVTLGKISQKIAYKDPTDIVTNASVYRGVLSKALPVTGELMATVISCAKTSGVRL